MPPYPEHTLSAVQLLISHVPLFTLKYISNHFSFETRINTFTYNKTGKNPSFFLRTKAFPCLVYLELNLV